MSSSGGTSGTNARTARPWSSRLLSTLAGCAARSSATRQWPFSATSDFMPDTVFGVPSTVSMNSFSACWRRISATSP
jgi:hypothetical protein